MSKQAHNRIDITGIKFHLLTVTGNNKRVGKKLVWECLCDCGNTTFVRSNRLRTGETKSCGCLIVESNLRTKTKHGALRSGKATHEYTVWSMMKQRCFNPRAVGYARYGGKGITVCERWLDFANFRDDMGPSPSPEHTIDRWPDSDGNYEPGNCRWATYKEQNRNRPGYSRIIEFNGQLRSLAEWCELLNLKRHRVDSRLALGWSVERAFTEPVLASRKGLPGIGRPKGSKNRKAML